MKKYKVAYVTGTRADYGIVRNYLRLLDNEQNIDLSILVTGAHLEEKFGYTIQNIVDDGFDIGFEANIELNTVCTSNVLRSMSIALEKFGNYFEENKFDLIIILGDRYEMLAVAEAAAMQKIPILHLHGGETTFGNYDEFIRHCITKMSRFHFASTEIYRKRIIQMGESPSYVFNLGSLGAENCTKIDLSKVDKMVVNLPQKKYMVIAFHPETLTSIDVVAQINIVLNSVSKYLNEYEMVFIGTNADTDADKIRQQVTEFVANHEHTHYYESLNSDTYLYLVKNSVCLIGNSSSGIIEAPSLGVYSLNIGDRQKGRIHGNSVIDVRCNQTLIEKAITEVIKCVKNNVEIANPYYQKNAACRYLEQTKKILEQDTSFPKEFYDLY